MDILAAYREVGSYRGAAEICGRHLHAALWSAIPSGRELRPATE